MFPFSSRSVIAHVFSPIVVSSSVSLYSNAAILLALSEIELSSSVSLVLKLESSLVCSVTVSEMESTWPVTVVIEPSSSVSFACSVEMELSIVVSFSCSADTEASIVPKESSSAVIDS